MKKYLLYALMLSGLMTSAQTGTININCKAYFKYTINDMLMSPIAATAINFYDKSEVAAGAGIAWFWDFGDGTTSREQNPMHMFLQPIPSPTGKFSPYRTVSLTILTTDSCKSLYSESINIMDGTTPVAPACSARFKYYQASFDSIIGTAAIQFNNYSEGDSLSYFWQFDNGMTSTEKEPIVKFDVKQPVSKVCLTVTGKNNCTDTFCDAVYIKIPGQPVIDPPVECQTAFGYQINYKIQTFAPALVLDFYSKASPDAIEWSWNFDDGTTSNEQNPTHIFNYPIVKDSILGDPNPFRKVCLTVKTISGCTASYCEMINIYMNTTQPVGPTPPCETAFGYSVNYDIKTFTPALVLNFNAKATPGVTEWNWNFGDGTISTEQNPTHIFNFPLNKDSVDYFPNGDRKVCLTIKTETGCVASYCETINIYMNTTPPVDPPQQCHAWFKYYRPALASIPEVIPYKLVDASEGKVVSRIWQFEDGTSSTEVEPLVNFNFMKPTQKVCLTIYTADSCSSTWCETIIVSEKPDTTYISKPDTIIISKPANIYKMHYISSFPIQMSSCAGYAKAEVFLNDSIIKADNYVWSNGATGQEVKGLCPTQIYSVKAITIDGTVVSGTFLFNSDGTVTEAPYDWWVTGVNDNPLMRDNLFNQNYTVEWKLCDGTIIRSDSIPRNSMNCGSEEATLILKDASGNVVYTNNISLKTMTTITASVQANPSIKFYPNPVKDVLNIQYSGSLLNEMQIEIRDITGKSISNQKIYRVEPGQNISLNVTSLPKGIYICKMVSEKQVIGMEKFIK